MPRVRVVRLSSKVPPRVGTICAFLFWFVSIAGPNRLPERPGGGDSSRVVIPEGLLVPC
jgi:hypothetical protein